MKTGKAETVTELTLAALAKKTGCLPRKVRFYVSLGLLPGPIKRGSGARYAENHVRRLDKIRHLQAEGMTLAEIGSKVTGRRLSSIIGPSKAWRSFTVKGGAMLLLPADVGAWRLREIKHALAEAGRQVSRMLAAAGSADNGEGGERVLVAEKVKKAGKKRQGR